MIYCINVRLHGELFNEVNANSRELRNWLRTIYGRDVPVVLDDDELEILEEKARNLGVPFEVA